MHASHVDERDQFGSSVAGEMVHMRRFAFSLLGNAHAADDLVQDALARAWRKRDAYDPAKGSFRAWLLAIVADQARQGWRKRWPELMPENWPDGATTDLTAQTDVDIDIRAALQRLSRRQRTIVFLFYFLDLAIADVATLLGCSEGTVKSTLSDSRRLLAMTLGGST